MPGLVLLTCLAVPVGAGLAHVATRLGPRLGLLDLPTTFKSHTRPVPRSAGLALGGALLLCMTAWGLAGGATPGLLPYALPGTGFLLLGLLDDRRRLGAAFKLGGQIALACSAVALGLRWEGAGSGPFPALTFGALTPVMSALWIVAVVTVVNFLDGIDSITVFTQVPLLALAAGAGVGPGEGALYAGALGALLGVGALNVTPARLFPGDGSTHLLGFLAAACALTPGPGGARALPWPVVGALLVPGVVDVGAGLWSKWRRGVALSAAHRDHPYQRLTRRGATHLSVAARYGALVTLAAATAIVGAPLLGATGAMAFGALVLGGHLLVAARAPRAPASFFDGASAPSGQHGGRMPAALKNFGWVRPGALAGMGLPRRDDWSELGALGVRAVLSLTETRPEGDPAAAGLETLHLPIADFAAPSDEDLLRATTWVLERMERGTAVVVHCFAGIGRTGTVLAAVLVRQGLSARAAIDEVRRLRPGSLETAAQCAVVQRLAQRLSRP